MGDKISEIAVSKDATELVRESARGMSYEGGGECDGDDDRKSPSTLEGEGVDVPDMTEPEAISPFSPTAVALGTMLPAVSFEGPPVVDMLRRSIDDRPSEFDIVASKLGGGTISDLDAENATASGPYGAPNLSSASLEVMSLICSGVRPPFGARNSERLRVYARGADIESTEMVEGDVMGAECSWKIFKSPEPEPDAPRLRLCPLLADANERDEPLWSGVTALS